MLWCILGFTKNEWTHAFKLLHQGVSEGGGAGR